MSDHPTQATQRGIDAIQKGEFGKAIELLNEAIQFASNDQTAYMYRGIAHRMRGDHEKALIDLSLAIELSGHFFPEAYRQRGLVYQAMGEMDRARHDLSVALSDRGVELAKQGDLSRAASCYGKAIDILPTFAQPFNNRAYIRLREGDLEGALADFNEAIRLKPDYEEAYSNRAAVLIRKRQFEKALQDCNAAIRIRPLYEPAYNNRALVHKAQGRYEQALSDCNTALMLKPDYAEAYGNRGMVHLLLLHPEKALADLERAVELGLDPKEIYDIMVGLQSLINPSEFENHQEERELVRKGVELTRSNLLDDAEATFIEAIETAPDSAPAYHHLGNLYRLRGEYDQAVQQYTQAIERDPTYTDAYLGRGLVYMEQEPQNYLFSVRDFTRVLDFDADRKVVYRLRGVAYLQMGRRAEAVVDLQKYLDDGGAAENNEIVQITSMVAELKRMTTETGTLGR